LKAIEQFLYLTVGIVGCYFVFTSFFIEDPVQSELTLIKGFMFIIWTQQMMIFDSISNLWRLANGFIKGISIQLTGEAEGKTNPNAD
jgi:hypothetical protein